MASFLPELRLTPEEIDRIDLARFTEQEADLILKLTDDWMNMYETLEELGVTRSILNLMDSNAVELRLQSQHPEI